MIRRFQRLVYGEHPNRGAGGGPPRSSYSAPGFASPTGGIANGRNDRAIQTHKREVKKKNRQKFRDYAAGYGLNQQQADRKYHEIITEHNKGAMTNANAQSLAAQNPGFRANNPARPSTRTKIAYDPKYGAAINTRTYSYGGGFLGSMAKLGPVGDMVGGSAKVNVNSFSVYDQLAKDHRSNPGKYTPSSSSGSSSQNRIAPKPTISPSRSPQPKPKPSSPSPKRSARTTTSPLMRTKRDLSGGGGSGSSGGVRLGKRL